MTAAELPGRLRCVGGELIKPNGKPILLRGVNFGSWGNDDPQDATYVASWGANCVRVALRWWGEYGEAQGPVDARDNDGFAFLSRPHVQRWFDLITSAAAAGLWVIPFLDSNCGQSGTQTPSMMHYCDPYGSWGAQGRNFFTDPAMRRTFTQIVWPTLAAKLRTISRIAALELLPEPAEGRGPEYAYKVRSLYREIIEAIRGVDTDTPVLIGAREGYAIKLCDEAWLEEDVQVIYTGNLLSGWVTYPDKFDEGLAALVAMREQRGVPIFVQQLGRRSGDDPDMAYMRRALDKMAEHRVGYAWWQNKQKGSSPDEYGLHYTGEGDVWVAKQNEIDTLSGYLKA